MLSNAHVTVQLNAGTVSESALASLQKNGTQIQSITLANGTTVSASQFIDASYEGDLLALAGVTTTVGRESNTQYNETGNGWGPIEYQSSMYNGQKLFINPFVSGNSGPLIPWVAPAFQNTPQVGSADSLVMAYTYRLCLQGSDNPSNQTPFTAPPGYSDSQYELFHRYLVALQATQPQPNPSSSPEPLISGVLHFGALPNNKFDINNSSMFSTDLTGFSSNYPTATRNQRSGIEQQHKYFLQGLLYYLAHGATSPVQSEIAGYGLCKDEFADTANWPHQLYVREARRMVSDYFVMERDVFRQDSETQAPYSTPSPIALGSYALDTHAVERFAMQVNANGTPTWTVATEAGSLQAVPNPYPISYASLVPKSDEVTNLLATNGLSSSHSAYRSIRMEPNYMMIGHAAGAAAALAVLYGNGQNQSLDFPSLAARLSADGLITDLPGVLRINDAGPTKDGASRNIQLIGNFPSPAEAYTYSKDYIEYAASCQACTSSGKVKTCQPLKPVGQSLKFLNNNEIDLVIAFAPSSSGNCNFRLNYFTPSTGQLHSTNYPTNPEQPLPMSPDN